MIISALILDILKEGSTGNELIRLPRFTSTHHPPDIQKNGFKRNIKHNYK